MNIHPLTTFYRLRGGWRQAASDRHERHELERFQRFYAGLADKENIFYLFFTSGLLHWLNRALDFVPGEVNAVLIGAGLGRDELAWLEEHAAPRPFHHIGETVDDDMVLDWVLKTVGRNFGWLHIDCFVLNPKLFGEMARIDDDVALNCIWSHPGLGGIDTLHTAFFFFNHQVVEKVRATGTEVWPVSSNYRGSPIGRTITGRKLWGRVPTRRQVRLLSQLIPPGASGLPPYPVGEYFHVMTLYQLLANALGYRLGQARNLVRDGSTSAAQYSEEIIHVNGVGTYKLYKDNKQSRGYRYYPLLLQADYAILKAMRSTLPDRYAALNRELRGELQRLGIPEEQAVVNLADFLMERGVSAVQCSRILGPDAARAQRRTAHA